MNETSTDHYDLTGRVAVVTGAASGIGASIVALLLRRGATVVGLDLEPAAVDPRAHAVALDVSDPVAVQRVFAALEADQLAADLLFNNAGAGSTADAVTCTAEEWDRVFAVNARGTFLCTRAVLPGMLARGRGVVVNTCSAAAHVGLRDRAAYCASKGAVLAFTRQVAVQYAGTGVRCCSVSPGTVDSPWVGRLLAEAGDPDERRAALVARQPVGRLGEPWEVAEAAVWLASDAALFATGTDLVIDGCLTAG